MLAKTDSSTRPGLPGQEMPICGAICKQNQKYMHGRTEMRPHAFDQPCVALIVRAPGAAWLHRKMPKGWSRLCGRNRWSGPNTLETGRESSGSQGNARNLLQYLEHPEFGNSQHSD